jgi:hypothetical protein
MRRRPPPHQQDSRKNEQTEQRKGGWRDKSCADINRRSRCLHIQKMAPTAALVSPLRAQPRGLFVRSCHCLAYDARQPTCVAFSQGRGAHAPYAMTRSASSSDASVTTRTARPSPTSRAFCAPPRRRSARPAVAAGRASPAHGSAAGARKGASPRSAALDPGGGGSSSRLALCASRGVARSYLRYVQREGVPREKEPGRLYGAATDDADGKAFLERGAGDRHEFHFIVSAEDGTELNDLKPFVRDLMRQMKHDLATRLECEARLGRLPTISIPPRSSLSWKRIDQRSARGLGSRSMGWASVVSAPVIFDRTHAMSGVARSALARRRRRAAPLLSLMARRYRAAPASPSLVRAICLTFPKSARQRRQTSPTVSCARQIGQCSTAHVSR